MTRHRTLAPMRPSAAAPWLLVLLAGGAPAARGDEPPPAPPPPPAFLDLARAAGLPTEEVKRAAAVDLDGDGRADLVFDAGKRVFLNRTEKGRLRFVETTKEAGLLPAVGRGADVLAWGDVDGDGDVDCFY